jgi:hypothetical protein
VTPNSHAATSHRAKPPRDSAIKKEGRRLTGFLTGKIVRSVVRHGPLEVLINIVDGTRLCIDDKADGFEFSITDGPVRR